MRNLFAIPKTAQLISLKASPAQSGTFGREGLRVFAVFQLNADQSAKFRESAEKLKWAPLPVSQKIRQFKNPPIELSQFNENGIYLCKVVTGQYIRHKYSEETIDAANAPGEFTAYYIGILDFNTHRLYTVYKSYY
ncbi:MAG: hypothetical protein PHN57_07155 [Candidatus Omnitrophica bacterium]|nr:hypothetical protein [Candidatus Omnitrophota bacterium]